MQCACYDFQLDPGVERGGERDMNWLAERSQIFLSSSPSSKGSHIIKRLYSILG